MPSVLVGYPLASGGQQIVSGNWFSGVGYKVPTGGVQLYWDINASGRCYIAFSGNMTINSGSLVTSGGFASGAIDGMPILPGGTYFVPRLVFGLSGQLGIYAQCDAAASGNRLWFEFF